MVFSSILLKTVSLSPKLPAVHVASRSIIGTSSGSLLLAPRSFSKSADKITTDEEKAIRKVEKKKKDHHINNLVNSEDVRKNEIKQIYSQMTGDYKKFKVSDFDDLSTVTLGDYLYQIQENDNGRTLILSRNDGDRQVVSIEVDLSLFESEEEGESCKLVPLTLTITREDYDGRKYDNQFNLSLSSKEMVVGSMSIKKYSSMDTSDDDSSDDNSDGSEDGSDDGSDDSSDNNADKGETKHEDSSDDTKHDDSSNDGSDNDNNSDEVETKLNDKNKELVYVGPDFKELDDHWQKGIQYYLEERGIKPEMISSFREYISKKKKIKSTSTWKKNFLETFLYFSDENDN